MRTFLTTAAMALAIVSAPVMAKHHGKWFDKKDLNKDEMISLEEHLKHAEERFKKMDANGDGKVSREEAKAAKEKMKEKRKKYKGE